MKIVQYPHPALRFRSRTLTSIDAKVRLQAGQMLELMYAARGVGLAANQVAWPVQLFVMNPKADPQARDFEHVLINPVIVERKGWMESDEGCLSFPGLFQTIRRAKTVKVQGYDLDGKLVEIVSSEVPPELCEMMSKVLQHEIDHLHGVLFIDKMGLLARMKSRGALQDFEREYRRAQERGDIPPNAEIEKMLASPTAEVL
jgi:peptide deformylase